MDNDTTSKKVVVVSGAVGYVGSAVVRQLTQDGFVVAALFHRKKSQSDYSYHCDLNDPAQVAAVLSQVERELGPLYACVHAAGAPLVRKNLLASSTEDLQQQLEVSVVGGFNFLKACALRLVEHKTGVIVGITSSVVSPQSSTRGLGAYTVGKYALQGMLTSLHEELLPHGVRVYSVAPGFMPGGMNRGIPPAFVEMLKERSPTKTLATPQDVAATVSRLVLSNSPVGDLTVFVAPELEK